LGQAWLKTPNLDLYGSHNALQGWAL
jgi:hypothetical protein